MHHTDRIPIDWQQLVLNLRRHINTRKIAALVGMSASNIQMYAEGKNTEPSFTLGIKLLDLHLEYCEPQHKKLLRNL